MVAVVLSMFATVGVQLLYPEGRGLPLASIPGKSLMLATHDDMAKAITDAFALSQLQLVLDDDKEVQFPLRTVGAEPNTEEMIRRMSHYPLLQRFIPGSILWQPARVMVADVYYTNTPLAAFVAARSSELSFPPKNAHLAIENGRLVASEAVAGSEVDAEELLRRISNTPMQLGSSTSVVVPAKRTNATHTTKDLEKVRTQAESVLSHTVILDVGTERLSPSNGEIASWVVLATSETGEVTLSIDVAKIKQYVDDVNKKVGTPAGQTDISIVDGREVGRTTGNPGRAIDSDAVSQQIADALLHKDPQEITVVAGFIDTPPSVIFNSKYTTTQAGLQAFVDDIARDRNMRISIQQLDGEKWSAHARDTESIPSASTYKLFVSLVLFDKMDKGEIHWDDPMLDTTVAGCFERMTVASTNPCAEKWIAMFSREYINEFIYARGFSAGTSFTTGYANQTTAADLSKFMIGLNNGTLVSGAYRDRLLDSLGRHPYRYGIPTGSAGVVHDKVGFLWDYVHDTAIVQHPRGTYIMTIMTKGQSYAAIATATREIERIMYP
jgi:vancomycin resistance protein YoaR